MTATTTQPRRTDIDIEALNARLLELQADTKASIARLIDQDDENLNTAGTDRAELSTVDNHPADAGTEMQLLEQDAALLENERLILAQIEHALDRIADGTYGFSELSGKPIPAERLEAIPYATTVVDE